MQITISVLKREADELARDLIPFRNATTMTTRHSLLLLLGLATANALRVVSPPTKYTATDNFLYLRGGADTAAISGSATSGRAWLTVLTRLLFPGNPPRERAPYVPPAPPPPPAARRNRPRARPQPRRFRRKAHATGGGAAGTVTAIKSKKEFDALLAATPSKRLVVVDFFATWCGPCQQIAPKYEAMAAQFQQAKFVKVDVDICKELSQSYGVSSMPTFKMIRGGKVVDEMNGADENALKEKIQGLAGKADRWASAGSARQI